MNLSIREGTRNTSSSRVVDSEVWPQEIKVKYQDETGQNIEFKREKNTTSTNLTDPVEGITNVEIDSYGQGETAETIQHSDENPKILSNFLDKFLDINAFRTEDEEVILQLRQNQSQSREKRLEILSLDQTKKALKNEEVKLSNLKKEKAGDLVKYQNALLKEREIRKNIIEDLRTLISSYETILTDKTIFENFKELTDDEIIVGKTQFKEVKKIVSQFAKIVESKSGELHKSLSEKVEELRTQIQSWKSKEKGIQSKIDAKKDELEKLGIPFDLGKINQISKDIITLRAKVKLLESSKKRLKELEEERKGFKKKRISLKEKIFQKRLAFSLIVNTNLKNTIDGLLISIKYDQGKYSPEFESYIKNLMGWRTVQVPKASVLLKHYSPFEFLAICSKRKKDQLKLVKDKDGNRIFYDSEIEQIISRVRNDFNFQDIECIQFDDKPKILVTKIVDDGQGGKKNITKSLGQLSLGQQQSVLLGILMLSKSNKPLLIDQPEDNLDSEFIFKTIVKNLRKIKERRQIIIVTHNANIAVLGDAELVIPLKSTSIKTHISDDGSIDRSETRKVCCEILEGGVSAFKQRQEIYGI